MRHLTTVLFSVCYWCMTQHQLCSKNLNAEIIFVFWYRSYWKSIFSSKPENSNHLYGIHVLFCSRSLVKILQGPESFINLFIFAKSWLLGDLHEMTSWSLSRSSWTGVLITKPPPYLTPLLAVSVEKQRIDWVGV